MIEKRECSFINCLQKPKKGSISLINTIEQYAANVGEDDFSKDEH